MIPCRRGSFENRDTSKSSCICTSVVSLAVPSWVRWVRWAMWAKWDSRISLVRDNPTHFINPIFVPSHLPILSKDSRQRILREGEILSCRHYGRKFAFSIISKQKSGEQTCVIMDHSNWHVTSQSQNERLNPSNRLSLPRHKAVQMLLQS